MTKVKWQCSNCGEVETYSTIEKIYYPIAKIILSLLVALGIVTFALILYYGPSEMISNLGVSTYLTINAKINTIELRHQAINATKLCREDYTTSSYCHAIMLYRHLNNLSYIPASLYDPILPISDTYKIGGGDCKAVSMLYVGMIKSLGFKAQVQCDNDHCIAIVQNKDYGIYYKEYLVADLTIPGLYEVDSYNEVWNYLDGVKVI